MRSLRVPLAAAVLIAGLLSVVNVHAYRRASAVDDTSFTIVSTDSAALALSSTSPLATPHNGMLAIDFSYGGREFYTGQSGPIAAPDDFQMKKVFKVSNTTTSCYTVSVYAPNGDATNLTDIWGYDNGGAAYHMAITGGQKSATFPMGITVTNKDLSLDFYWKASSTASRTNFHLLVSATGRTCP